MSVFSTILRLLTGNKTAADPGDVAEPPNPEPAEPVRTVAQAMTLGCVDSDIQDATCSEYISLLAEITRVHPDNVRTSDDKLQISRLPARSADTMTVSDVQTGLKQIGFFPGGELDGIYGYRTRSALRLFQEYVRSVEGLACLPDGVFGPQTNGHLQRWLQNGLRPEWGASSSEYDAWLNFLAAVKHKYITAPDAVQLAVNAYQGKTDTRPAPSWEVDGEDKIHLIGIRRNDFSGKFDDVFILLIKGMVFKFQGTTEPGHTKNSKGMPFLVPGQHEYHFGWHLSEYQALRPIGAFHGHGVLIIRAGSNDKLDPSDLDKGLEANGTINIHWGGFGVHKNTGGVTSSGNEWDWSEGCQVITGGCYINPKGDLISCASYAAHLSKEPIRNSRKTRGAYSVITDIVTALSGDMSSNTVLYTMVSEGDLNLDPGIKNLIQTSRDAVLNAELT